MKDGVIHLRNVDPELKAAFKAICALRGLTMTDAFQLYMKEAVKEKTLPLLHKERAGELFAQ